jgi:alpha-L-fucosidase 2
MEALPLGSGRIGVMAFGVPTNGHFQLNNDSLWSKDTVWKEPDGKKEDLAKIRSLLMKGENSAADALFVKKFSDKIILRSHQTLCDLSITLVHKSLTDYRRELNLNIVVHSVIYKADGNWVTEQTFVSHPDNAIVIEIITEAANGLNAVIKMNRPEDHGFVTSKTKAMGGELIMEGEVIQRGANFRNEPSLILNGVRFET